MTGADDQFDTFCKHIALAGSYSTLGLKDGETLRPHGVSGDDDFPWDITDIPELIYMSELFDRVLTRADGFTFEILLIKNGLGEGAKQVAVPLYDLKLSGLNCLHYTGKIQGSKMPVNMQVWEVSRSHDGGLGHLQALKSHVTHAEKIGITSWAINLTSQGIWTNARFKGIFKGRKAIERALHATVAGEKPQTNPGAQIGASDKFPILTFGLVGVMVLFFCLQLILGQYTSFLSPTTSSALALGGLNPHSVLDFGQWYRLYSAGFLHADPIHLLFNCVALFFGGLMLESWVGRSWFMIVFSVGLLGGSLASLLFNSPETVSVGASGAVMGMLAAAFVVSYKLPWGHEQTSARMHLLYWLLPALIPLFSRDSGEQIDFAAHFGGAAAGFLMGAFILKTWKPGSRLPSFHREAMGVAGASVVFIYMAMVKAYINRGFWG